MTPLWTTAILPDWSRCGWEFSSDGGPCVAQRVWAMPRLPATGSDFNRRARPSSILPFFLRTSRSSPSQHGHARAVVAAIFQPPQAFEQDGRGRFFTDVSNDAAHILIIRKSECRDPKPNQASGHRLLQIFQNPIRRAGQIVHDDGARNYSRRFAFQFRAVTGADEDALFHARVPAAFQITQLVADQESFAPGPGRIRRARRTKIAATACVRGSARRVFPARCKFSRSARRARASSRQRCSFTRSTSASVK